MLLTGLAGALLFCLTVGFLSFSIGLFIVRVGFGNKSLRAFIATLQPITVIKHRQNKPVVAKKSNMNGAFNK